MYTESVRRDHIECYKDHNGRADMPFQNVNLPILRILVLTFEEAFFNAHID